MGKFMRAVTFDPRPLRVGSEWYVIATYPTGQEKQVTGFRTEADAKAWINSDKRKDLA
jgi:hypothetical protein